MIKIINENTDPRINLAVEEYALNYLDPSQDYAILWQNEPAVIVGRNQNTVAEVNAPFIKEKGIHVVRRLSGGGAVYHDLGNLNFTFIVDSEKSVVSNFEYFTKPVIQALESLGVKAEFSGRNDITIQGQKFSGNAQYWSKNRLLHHGTILFKSDLSVVQEALNVKADKIQSKGVKSVRSRVTNIYPHLPTPITIEEFKETLWRYLIPGGSDQEYVLTEQDWSVIKDLKDRRYSQWDWNYGASPDAEIEKEERFAGGKLELKFNVTDGVIQDMNIFGDFFGKLNVAHFANMLNGNDYRETVIAELLDQVNFEDYFIGITREDFLHCLFS
ncbi:MAG TPA: lipoate--protein ligase [Firmicutes bacterium]|jgi:lipoate-protein ligase A|nr:lipoate--protein ligase [Bacillota bacterium]